MEKKGERRERSGVLSIATQYSTARDSGGRLYRIRIKSNVMQNTSISYHVIPCHIISYLIISYHIILRHLIVSCYVILCETMS